VAWWIVAGVIVTASAGLAGPAAQQTCTIPGPAVVLSDTVVCTLTCQSGQTLHMSGGGVLIRYRVACGGTEITCDDLAAECPPIDAPISIGGSGACSMSGFLGLLPGLATDFTCSVT